MKKIWVLSLLSLATIWGCQKQLSVEEQLALDIEIIEKYLADNGLEAEKTASGLHYIINNLGTGAFPSPNDKVTVRYKGYFTDDKVFDQSSELGISFNLQGVIQGWTEGIPKFREGGDGILLIPSKLGYGPNGNSSIPKNSVLIFDVKLLEIVN